MDVWGINEGLEGRKGIIGYKRKPCNEALKMPMLAVNGSIYNSGGKTLSLDVKCVFGFRERQRQ